MKYIIGKEYMYFGNFAKLIDIQGEEPHRLFIVEGRFGDFAEVWEDSGNLSEKAPKQKKSL